MSEKYSDPIAAKLAQLKNQKIDTLTSSGGSKNNIREQLGSVLDDIIPDDTKLTSWIQKNIDEKTGVNTTTTKQEYIEKVLATNISETSKKFISIFLSENKDAPNLKELLDQQLELHTKLLILMTRLNNIHFDDKDLNTGILNYRTKKTLRMGEELSGEEVQKILDDTVSYEQAYKVYGYYEKNKNIIVSENQKNIESKLHSFINGKIRVSKGELDALTTIVNNSKKIYDIQELLKNKKKYINSFVQNEIIDELNNYTVSIESTGTEELVRIETIIKNEYNLFHRVKRLLSNSIDVTGFDPFVEGKKGYKEFFYQFTKEYIAFARKNNQKVNYKNALSLNDGEIEQIIKNIPPATYDAINGDIDITITGKEKPVNIAHHIEKIQLMRNKKAAAVHALWKFSKHIPRSNISAIKIVTLLNIPASDGIVEKMEKTGLLSDSPLPLLEVHSLLEKNKSIIRPKHLKELLKNYIKPGTKTSLTFLGKLSDNKIISRSLALDLIEAKGGFKKTGVSLGEVLRTIGVPKNIHMLVAKILKKDITEIPEKRIQQFLQFVLAIESSGGYNVANYAGVSSAKGYFQYLTMNGKWKKNKNGKFLRNKKGEKIWLRNSYEVAMYRLNYLMGRSTIQKLYPNIAQQSKLEREQTKQNPMLLSSAEQIVLFLSDILQNSKSQKYLKDVFLGKDTAKRAVGTKKLYSNVHHSSPDKFTKRLIEKAEKKYL